MVARLANALGYELTKAEAAKAAHSTNPDAIDLTMRGLALLLPATQTKESNNSARSLFQQALAIDPNESTRWLASRIRISFLTTQDGIVHPSIMTLR